MIQTSGTQQIESAYQLYGDSLDYRVIDGDSWLVNVTGERKFELIAETLYTKTQFATIVAKASEKLEARRLYNAYWKVQEARTKWYASNLPEHLAADDVAVDNEALKVLLGHIGQLPGPYPDLKIGSGEP